MLQLLQEVRHEIESLRQQNATLRAKVEVLDLFTVAFFGHRPMSASIDVAWMLQQKIKELETLSQQQAQQDAAEQQ